MLTPGDLRNPPRRHPFPRRTVKVPLGMSGLNGVNDGRFTEHEFLRPADPPKLHNDYAALLKEKGMAGMGDVNTFSSKLKATTTKYKWPLIIGGLLGLGVAGYYIYRKIKARKAGS